MTYRPDIDGLRAIAVILVLIYHGGLALFPSGFVGVDVFFVISGFLITSIIYNSLNDKAFSFTTFYSRRLWRLQPVFVCLILVTLLLSLLLFLPDDLQLFSDSARKTSLFISNIYFYKTTTGYFAPNTHQLPLLHTWSLSIEWQCYLILPLLIYGLYKIVPERKLFVIISILTLLSFIGALYTAQVDPVESYYQFSSRIFEFLLGSSIALLPFKSRSGNKQLINSLGVLALLIIFYCASQDKILIGYPNGFALLVCLATGFLIALGKYYPGHGIVKVLSWKPLVFIGLLSYSLYIWHWVVFSMLRYETISETPFILAIAYGLSCILAYVSWKFIEKPARRFNYIKFRYTFIILLLLPIVLTHVNSFLVNKYSGFPQRFGADLASIYQKLNAYDSKDRPLCISKDNIDINAHCKIGAKDSTSKTGLMIGDSYSNHYWGFVDTLGKNAHVSILAQGTSSCLTLPGVYLYDWWYFKNDVYQECFDKTQTYFHMIEQNHYDYVIIGQIWQNYYTDKIITKLGEDRSVDLTKERIEIALTKALDIIVRSGAKPVLMKSTANRQENVHDCVFQYIKMHKPYDASSCSFKLELSKADLWFDSLFEKMRAHYPQLLIIDPKKVQCPQQVCTSDIEGAPVYRDAGHITDFASYAFGALYLKNYGNPLLG